MTATALHSWLQQQAGVTTAEQEKRAASVSPTNGAPPCAPPSSPIMQSEGSTSTSFVDSRVAHTCDHGNERLLQGETKVAEGVGGCLQGEREGEPQTRFKKEEVAMRRGGARGESVEASTTKEEVAMRQGEGAKASMTKGETAMTQGDATGIRVTAVPGKDRGWDALRTNDVITHMDGVPGDAPF
jgi:hypothetical protein